MLYHPHNNNILMIYHPHRAMQHALSAYHPNAPCNTMQIVHKTTQCSIPSPRIGGEQTALLGWLLAQPSRQHSAACDIPIAGRPSAAPTHAHTHARTHTHTHAHARPRTHTHTRRRRPGPLWRAGLEIIVFFSRNHCIFQPKSHSQKIILKKYRIF